MPGLLPPVVERQLTSDIYQRATPSGVARALDTLGVYPSAVFVEFYSRFVGTFGSDTEPFELLDLYENGDDNIAHLTQEARDTIGLDSRFPTLTPYGDGGFLILDTESDHVYYADAEGGTEDAANGLLEPYAISCLEFLVSYFAHHTNIEQR